MMAPASRKRAAEVMEAIMSQKQSLDTVMTPSASPCRHSSRLAHANPRRRCEYHVDADACGCSAMQDANPCDHHVWEARAAMPARVDAAAAVVTLPLGFRTTKEAEMSEKVSPSLLDIVNVACEGNSPLKGTVVLKEVPAVGRFGAETVPPAMMFGPENTVKDGVPEPKEAGAASDGVPEPKEAGAPTAADRVRITRGKRKQASLHDNISDNVPRSKRKLSLGNAKVTAGSAHQDTRACPPSASQLPPSLKQTPPLRHDVAISGSLEPFGVSKE